MLTAPQETLPDTDASAASGKLIRAFAAEDAQAVADLLVRTFQKQDRPAPAGMASYLREVYLDAPWVDPEIGSRVAVDAQGKIVGFLGVSAVPMQMGRRTIRTAVTSSLAVDDRAKDPMLGARLLRDLRSGPQEAILSDRSNPAAVALLRSLPAEIVRDYSWDWVRSLRPAALAIETLAGRFGGLRLLAPLVAPLDAAALIRARDSEARWIAPGPARFADSFIDREPQPGELPGLVQKFIAHYPLHPHWSNRDLATILEHAGQRRTLGELVARVVTTRSSDNPVGLFLYHLKPGRTAHVLQILAAPRRESIVIDRLIAHALEAGAVALRGRAYPAIIDALTERRCVFLPELTTVVHSRDEELLRHFRDGSAFFTGLAGESWMRLNGDSF